MPLPQTQIKSCKADMPVSDLIACVETFERLLKDFDAAKIGERGEDYDAVITAVWSIRSNYKLDT